MTPTQLIKQELLETALKLLKMNATATMILALETKNEQIKATLRAIGNNITEVVLYVTAKLAMNQFIEVTDKESDAVIEKTKNVLFQSALCLRTLSTANEDNKELADKLFSLSNLQHKAYRTCEITLSAIKEVEAEK